MLRRSSNAFSGVLSIAASIIESKGLDGSANRCRGEQITGCHDGHLLRLRKPRDCDFLPGDTSASGFVRVDFHLRKSKTPRINEYPWRKRKQKIFLKKVLLSGFCPGFILPVLRGIFRQDGLQLLSGLPLIQSACPQ